MRNGARSKPNRLRRTNTKFSSARSEKKIAEMMQAIVELENFKGTIAPFLAKDIKDGLTAKDMREKYRDMLTARVITDALKESDPAKALSAIKDILDRSEGKATEKKEVTHKFDKMEEKELDAILQSEIEDLEDMQGRFDQ